MKFFLIISLLFYLSCVKTNQNENDIDSLLNYTIKFKPRQINSLNDDSLKKFNLIQIFNSNNVDEKKKYEVANILLLKQYLYHLKIANQSYNLNDFKTKDSRIIIDYFLQKNNIDSNVEFLSSAKPYEYLKKVKGNNKKISTLIDEINSEEIRLQK